MTVLATTIPSGPPIVPICVTHVKNVQSQMFVASTHCIGNYYFAGAELIVRPGVDLSFGQAIALLDRECRSTYPLRLR